MTMMHLQFAPAAHAGLLRAASEAARAIPPAFPLQATVAVNPFLGQSGQDFAAASALLSRVAGIRLTAPRHDYRARLESGEIGEADLAAALEASASPLKPTSTAALRQVAARDRAAPKPLPTLAELAAATHGTDWPAVMARSLGLWASGHFDRGQALWSPAPGRSAFAAWRAWAVHDLTPEIAGLSGFCTHAAEAPDTPERALLRAAEVLGLDEAAAATVFHRLLIDLGGWAQHARWLSWEAELRGGSDATLTDLLAIRLIWEEALLVRWPDLAAPWAEVAAAHAAPVTASADDVADAILQDALERAHQCRIAGRLASPVARPQRPALQAAFCIDVRSEVFRRALEALDPGVETLGFAGFFGLPVAHRPAGTDLLEPHLPVLLSPAMTSSGHAAPAAEAASRITARARRAWGRFRQAAVSSFAFVEAAGPAYAVKLVAGSLAFYAPAPKPAPMPRFETVAPAEERAKLAATVLKAMSLTANHAPVVLLLGHGAQLCNNPHESAYHCGACGGQTGEVSSRLLAALLNDDAVRAGLARHDIHVPGDTVFVAGLHDTTTDMVTLYADDLSENLAAALAPVRSLLARAGAAARAERAPRLPGATPEQLFRRARSWAEVRPEWGLADCAAFLAAPRSVTASADLGGRAFLHSYDWTADTNFATLELILTAPVVVASWISLQYYGSSIAPDVFGSGNKLIHNVVGGFGVLQGNGGGLCTGLPRQAVHDGTRPVHEPLRLTVLVEAPQEAVAAILARHPQVRALFDNGWLHLVTLSQGRFAARYRPGNRWQQVAAERAAA